jgi:hypothetical protein
LRGFDRPPKAAHSTPSRDGRRSHLDGSGCARIILDTRTSLDHPLGDAIETFIRREDAERFIEEVRGDDPALRELPAD